MEKGGGERVVTGFIGRSSCEAVAPSLHRCSPAAGDAGACEASHTQLALHAPAPAASAPPACSSAQLRWWLLRADGGAVRETRSGKARAGACCGRRAGHQLLSPRRLQRCLQNLHAARGSDPVGDVGGCWRRCRVGGTRRGSRQKLCQKIFARWRDAALVAGQRGRRGIHRRRARRRRRRARGASFSSRPAGCVA